MTDTEKWLEPTEAAALNGTEELTGTGATVRDFWSFAFSDLRNNVIRGVLAEFLVARALNSEPRVRHSWDDFDVLTPGDVRVEVKSSAYLQSWRQRKLSTIRFNGLTGLPWHDVDGWGKERTVRADVFVFAVHTCEVPTDYQPLDTAQWEFYVASAEAVSDNQARSVGLSFLRRYATGPLRWDELEAAVKQAASRPE